MRRAASLALAGLLAVMVAAPAQANTVTTGTYTLTVPATAGPATATGSTGYVDSGWSLSDTVVSLSVKAAGTVMTNPTWPAYDADGSGPCNLSCPAPGLPAYALIAQVGTGPWTFVGVGPTTLTGTGEVLFAYNDGNYSDNYVAGTSYPSPGNAFTVTMTPTYNLPDVTTSCTGIVPGTYAGFSQVGTSIFVPANTAAGATGPAFTYGAAYKVESQGVYQFGSSPTWLADADWSYGFTGPTWVKSISGYPTYDLNLLINGNGVDWGAFSSSHTYTYDLIGTGAPADFGLSILDQSNGGTPYYYDNTGGLCASVFKDDVAPTVSNVALSATLVPINTPVTLTATADDTTTGDSYISGAEYSVNGGSWTAMSASDGSFDSATEGVTASLSPSTPGVYSVCVKATDAADNTSNQACATDTLVVYDPSAGFVTGGGRDNLNNNFGFVAKYQAGGTVPVGSLEYQSPVGNFHSNSFGYLIVNGNTATLAGTGTLDGVSGYSFTLTVTDASPDTFGITFTNGSTSYTLESSPISKGSIQIHS